VNRQRVADAKSGHIHRSRHLPPYFVGIVFESDMARAKLFSAAP